MYDKAYYDKHKHDPAWMDIRNLRQKESYWRNRAKRIADMAKRRLARRKDIASAKNWASKKMLSDARSRALKAGIPFSISLTDILTPDYCPVLGMTLDWLAKSPQPNSPSLDRIINADGYVPGNVWVISRRANGIKSDATPGELEKIARAVGKRAAGRLLDGVEHNGMPGKA